MMNSTYWCIRLSKTRPLNSGNILNTVCHAKFSLILTWNIQGLFCKYCGMLRSVCRIYPLDLILSPRKYPKQRILSKRQLTWHKTLEMSVCIFITFRKIVLSVRNAQGLTWKNEALTQIFSSSHSLS